MTELIRLPRERDYDSAIRLTTRDFRELGGPMAWIVQRQKLTSTHFSIFYENLEAGANARYLEPLDRHEDVIDSDMKATHAFKHGMLAGHKVVKYAHRNHYSASDTTRFVTRMVQSVLTEGGDRNDVESTLIEMGDNGLYNAGERATRAIEK
jgi:hypothetical protein